jgi:hypothetical protein
MGCRCVLPQNLHPDELRELTEELHKNGYRWEIGQISAFGYIVPYRLTYLIGMPMQ